MDNQSNPTANQNENTRSNPNINSIDGFARPSQQSQSTNDNQSSLLNNSSTSQNNSDTNSSESSNNHQEQPNATVTPIKSGGNDVKKSKIWTIVLILLILLVFIGSIYGVYAYQQKKIDSLTGLVVDANSNIASLNKKLSSQPTKKVVVGNISGTTANTTVFKISELGVAFVVPNSLSDLNYIMTSTGSTANLSSQNLGTLDAACKATATIAPLGAITKVTGQFPSTSTTSTLIKQYPTYYIAYIKPVGNCSTVTQINTFVTALQAELKTVTTTITLITK